MTQSVNLNYSDIYTNPSRLEDICEHMCTPLTRRLIFSHMPADSYARRESRATHSSLLYILGGGLWLLCQRRENESFKFGVFIIELVTSTQVSKGKHSSFLHIRFPVSKQVHQSRSDHTAIKLSNEIACGGRRPYCQSRLKLQGLRNRN